MSSTERKIAAKPLDFAPGRPAVTPADRASVAASAAPLPAAALEPLITAGAADKASGTVAGLKGVVVYLEPAEAIALKVYAAQNNTCGSFVVGPSILMLQLLGFDGAVAVCRLQSRQAGGSARHRIVAAAAGVCRSTQTGSAAHSSPAPSARTSPRSPQGCADAVRPALGA